MTPAIEIRELAPPADAAHEDRLTLEVPAGTLMVLQTTRRLADHVIRSCCGLDVPPPGVVTVLGKDIARLSRSQLNRLRHQFGVALQPGGLISNQTLRMNLVAPLLFAGGVTQAEATARADQLLDRCGLGEWADRRPGEISPDLRQIAVVARALVRTPQVMLLADPFGSLDAEQSQRLLRLVREQRTTILLATHRRDTAVSAVADEFATWQAWTPEKEHEIRTN